ncbi:LysM peptidoglycan-binding domain-containing protein [Bizionia gelidisalsuginis]|uniref:LysM peptidoglycan-binding domain-containing protein n=1 Tax=Bizionia gelidisalsuginis TaxID=291188 RepID=A0ABY3MDG4_9FLAO|nr:LysM peptidoglycan-binding domain-containing protein [Bizionia gelidisalsuginis]TYC17047.1 LysM peptidoglycan-binding domain-containing protein [Bizionia gelidisalsuginis]
MRKIIVTALIALSFLGCSSLQGQDYSTHKVTSGETLESISKHYKVSVPAILGLNPDARKGLKSNTVLIIPKEGTLISSPIRNVAVVNEVEKFISHKVKRKETLYSLSKTYNIPQAEIKKYNTFLYANNLRKGDELQIPVLKKVAETVGGEEGRTNTNVETEKNTSETTNTYVVQPKEGKWRIAYKYDITVKELEDLNPGLPEILQPGETIKVPNLKTKAIKNVDEKYSYYTVLPKEGFYRLKVKTGLDQAVLEQLNPGLAETGLKEGMVLKVPYDRSLAAENNSESIPMPGNELLSTNLASQLGVNKAGVKEIAIMLPFRLHKMDVDTADTKELIKNDKTLSISLDFYSGALIALDSLKKLGANLKVTVFDTKNMHSELLSILDNNNFKNTDAVIGPLMPKNFNTVASALRNDTVAVVSPITKTVTLGSNVFQSRASDADLEKAIIHHFKNQPATNFVFVSDQKHRAKANTLKTEFIGASSVSSRNDKKTGKDAFYIFDQDIIKALKPGKNVVFLETDNSGFISNVTSILNSLNDSDKREITLATSGQNKPFEADIVSNYHLSNLKFTYPAVSKVVNEDENNSFVRTYEKQYGLTPNAYVVRGFDVTMDVALRLLTSDDLYLSVNDAPLTKHVESKFSYKKKLFGGYFNDAVYIVHYNNLKIEEVKQ